MPPSTSEARDRRPFATYGPPTLAAPWKAGSLSGQAFVLQADGLVRCPAGKLLHPTERRREREGTLRLVYAARIADYRGCPLREHCQWQGNQTTKSRRMSVLFHPLRVGPNPLLWRDWPRREHRRAVMQLVRRQRVEVTLAAPLPPPVDPAPSILARAQRAHARLSWEARLCRNARASTAGQPTITLFGVPDAFATFLGLRAT